MIFGIAPVWPSGLGGAPLTMSGIITAVAIVAVLVWVIHRRG